MNKSIYTFPKKRAQLLQAIMGDFWLITQNAANGYLPFVKAILEGNIKQMEAFSGEFSQITPIAVHDGKKMPMEEALPNSTAIIEIYGTLTKYDGWCNYGMETIGNWAKQADANENIDEIIFIADTPGGQASGTEELSNTIASVQKPKMAWVNGQACSAGYFGIVPCDHIMLSSNSAMVGSIGTQLSAVDHRPVLEEMGYKFHDVRATKSTAKNQGYFDLLQGDYEGIIKNYLDPLNEIFINQVEKYRSVEQEATTGKIYFGQAAIDAGLADSMGTLEDAIQKTKELTIKSQNEVTMGFFSDIFNKKKAEAKQKGKELTPEQLEQAAEQEVENIKLENQSLKEQSEALELALDQSKEQQNALIKKNEELAAENEQLGKKTVANPVQTDKNKDDLSDPNKKIPLLDVEEKAIDQGIQIDNTSFRRIKGITL